MERLSTQQTAATQDASGCISLCYQPLNVQSVDSQTAVAVQSLLDSQGVPDAPQDEEDDIFQCGKCKKQFTSLNAFVGHKQSQCVTPQQHQHIQQTPQQQPQQLTIGTGPSTFTPSLNLAQPFSQQQVQVPVSTMTATASILQAHPCLTRSLNQSNNGGLTLSGVPSSPISQLSQNMVFTDELLALTNLDTSSLTGQTIQMVTGPIPGQQAHNSNGVTIFSPITSLAASPNNFPQTNGPTGQLLVQPAQQITLATIATPDKSIQPQQLQPQHILHQHQLPQSQAMPPPPAPLVTTSQPAQQTIQPAIFKPSPTKAGRKSAQNNFITILNPDPSTSLLSTRKGKTARNVNASAEAKEEEVNVKPKLRCEYCNKLFTKNFDLQQHVRAHTGEKPFQCIVCGRAFAQKSNVKKHMATHKVWPCGNSNTLPKQPKPESEGHVAEGDVTTLNNADISQSESVKVEQLKAENKDGHAFVEKGNEENSPKMKVVVDNSYVCQYCPAKFRTYYQLKTHLVDHKNEQVYKCVMKKCSRAFIDLDAFLEHVKTHENEMTYRCHQCHKYFPSLHEVGVHQYSHSLYPSQGVKAGPRHFQCTKCGNKYTSPEALDHHLSTTSHDYKCPHCNKLFSCERFLRRHLPIHGSDGQFECFHCKKRFKTEHYLKSHILIHTGETPYTCEVCQAAFNRKDKLKRHMTIHDTVKKYRCPFRKIAGCTKEFNRPDKLKAHIITHSGIKPYKCSICGKGFSRRPHMVEHERGHNADYRFKCEKCGKGFFRPKLFNEHKCQSSKAGSEQTFRPRSRRKIGRPRKRMISIRPDPVSKTRGKQYPSRTRGKGKVAAQTAAELVAEQLANKQKWRQAKKKNVTLEKETTSETNEEFAGSQNVKALPLIASSNTSNLNGVGGVNVKIQGIASMKDEHGGGSLGPHLQHISLGTPGGELVDHYVVHLTESMDGSSPSIQTTFIPAASSSQMFAAAHGSMGIQPIAIIEAQSVNMARGHVAQVITSNSGDSAINCDQSQGQTDLEAQVRSVDNQVLLAVTNPGTEPHSAGSSGGLQTLEEANGMLSSSQAGLLASGDVMVGGQDSTRLIDSRSSSLCKDVKNEDANAVMVIGSRDGLMLGSNEMVGGDGGSDMMVDVDRSLSLFPSQSSNGQSYIEGRVVVSGDQTFLTCSTQLVDYSSGDTVLQGSSLN